MAKSGETSWLPSGGVLVVATGAALVAAIIVNVYLGYVKSAYDVGPKLFAQAKQDIEPNTLIKESHLKFVRVPLPFEKSIVKAVDKDGLKSVLDNKRTPRRIAAGEFLWYRDFTDDKKGQTDEVRPPAGYELLAVPINPTNSPGSMLQPGGYATLRGDFDFDPDTRRQDIHIEDVLTNVPVKAVGGSTAPTSKSQSYDNIHVLLRSAQIRPLLQIQRALVSRKFTVTIATQEGTGAGEPQINKAILDLVGKPKALPAEAAP